MHVPALDPLLCLYVVHKKEEDERVPIESGYTRCRDFEFVIGVTVCHVEPIGHS